MAGFRKNAARRGDGLHLGSALPPGLSLALDHQTAAKATDYHWRLIDAAKTLGASLVCGPLYHAVGEFPTGVTQGELLDKLGSRIAYLGLPYNGANVKLAIEPVNRYESSVLNTCAAAAGVVAKARGDWLGVCTDTYHLHREEKSYDALDALGPRGPTPTPGRTTAACRARARSGGTHGPPPSEGTSSTATWSSRPSASASRTWPTPLSSGGMSQPTRWNWPSRRTRSSAV